MIRIGRIATEEVVLHLLLTKCVPILLYGLEACSIRKTDLDSLDFIRFIRFISTEMQIRFEEVLVQQPYYSTNMLYSLPDSVVLADTVNQFKNRLDKHWANYAFLYDYLVNYNGTGACLLYRKIVKI